MEAASLTSSAHSCSGWESNKSCVHIAFTLALSFSASRTLIIPRKVNDKDMRPHSLAAITNFICLRE